MFLNTQTHSGTFTKQFLNLRLGTQQQITMCEWHTCELSKALKEMNPC